MSSFEEQIRKVLEGTREEFQEIMNDLDKSFEDGSAFRKLDEDEEYEFRLWAQMNYVPGERISPIWHPAVQDECGLMNNGLLIDPEQMKKNKGEYPRWYLEADQDATLPT
jgi:hypothetical protein